MSEQVEMTCVLDNEIAIKELTMKQIDDWQRGIGEGTVELFHRLAGVEDK